MTRGSSPTEATGLHLIFEVLIDSEPCCIATVNFGLNQVCSRLAVLPDSGSIHLRDGLPKAGCFSKTKTTQHFSKYNKIFVLIIFFFLQRKGK